ncbi:uncharacterized protein PHACADRAFT_253738 [Phanerochaete carnosa HHB-10118-sp]|uniref:Uncharacterized protein n=1 Tax=Phanerochaete carnosa (strain HHB-10118-sp) TaxID=650164 RepID=K5X1A3_PHACS|nr:uncharacterized protein PHACADRAFT_253738 [Phanerochaete carnosa HHB-10118-sp]EKM56547.1 hypothetical protein PHACADRAFT_253738 [Phanerochaete carnosa HHB-10118-sp]
MGPQQYQTWHGRSAPTGWSGSWPPSAPMPNPPPQPPGVDPRAWTGGQWQWNPMFRGNPTVQATLWAPHPSWGVPAAAAPAYNPYKRIPNPGDAAYYATELKKNPLGLENMWTVEELEKMSKEVEEREGAKQRSKDDGAPQTPWLWVPKELSKSDDRPEEQPDIGNGLGVRDSQNSSQTHQHHHHSSKQPQPASAGISAQQMQEQQQRAHRHHHHRSPTHRTASQNIYPSSDAEGTRTLRRSRTESLVQSSMQPSSAPAAVSVFSQYYQQQQQQRQQQQQPRQQESQTQSAIPNPPRTPTQVSTASAQALAPSAVSPKPPRTPTHVSTASSQTRSDGGSADSVFNSQQQLKPTFSANIIRTPQHYIGAGSSSASATAGAATPTRRPTREGSRDDTTTRPSSLSSPPRHTRASSRARNALIDTDTETDDESPARPHAHGPIYGPPTPSPSGPADSGVATPSQASHRDSSAPSIGSTLLSMTLLSSMTLDTPPTSASSGVFLSSFTDEPTGILSPLIVASVPAPCKSSPSPREMSRSHTYPLVATSSQSPPSSIPVIPEESPSASLSRAPSRSSKTPKRSPSTHARAPGRSRTYPSLDPTVSGEPAVIPPMPSPTYMPPVVPSRVPSPSPNKNPLPPPPMPAAYVSSASSSASAAAAASQASQEYNRQRAQSRAQSSSRPPSDSYQSHQSQTSSHQTSHQPIHQSSHQNSRSSSQQASPRRRQVRYGYWNRRGDHLLMISDSPSLPSPRSAHKAQQFVVYAPPSYAMPEELAHYPHALEGWMNHRGETLPYDRNVPEFPDSLPVRGEDPRKPYKTFIKYTYI